jgi:nucleoside-diphosphate-sugar epimerase
MRTPRRRRTRTGGKSWSLSGCEHYHEDYGLETRSFCYIDDCVVGIYKPMCSDYREPLNLGEDRLISSNELADMVAAVAGVTVRKRHVPRPQGFAVGTRTTRGCDMCSAGSRRPRL